MSVFYLSDIGSGLTRRIKVNKLVRDVRWFLDVREFFPRVVSRHLGVAAHVFFVVFWTFG
jgi:hypothetical protein